MLLSIGIHEPKPGLFQVDLEGSLDIHTSGELEKRLKDLLAKDLRAVRFELSRLNYLSSHGIRALYVASRTLREKKALFQMANLQPQVKKVLDITQAFPPHSMFASIREADEFYDSMCRNTPAK